MSTQHSFEAYSFNQLQPIPSDQSPALNLLQPTPNPLSFIKLKQTKSEDIDFNEDTINNNLQPQTMLTSSFVGSKLINRKPIHPVLEEIIMINSLNYSALLSYIQQLHYYLSISDGQVSQLQMVNFHYIENLVLLNNELSDQITSLQRELLNREYPKQQQTQTQVEEIEMTQKKEQVIYQPQPLRYEIDLRKEMVELEKENIDLKMLVEEYLMEINSLKNHQQYLERLETQKPERQVVYVEQPAPPNYEKDALVHQIRQYQERIIQVDQSHSNKQIELNNAIEGLVEENSILLQKYNMIVDQLRAMKLVNSDLNSELHNVQDQKMSTERIYDELRIGYAKLKSKYSDMQAAYEEELQLRINSISELEETLASTRDQLFLQQNQIQELQQQLQQYLIQQQQNQPTLKVYNTEDVNRLKERIYGIEEEREVEKGRHQQELKAKDESANDLKEKILKLEAQLEAEKYLAKQQETKINQLEKQLLELGFEKEKLFMRVNEYEQKLLNFNDYRGDTSGVQNNKQVYENKIMFLEQQLSGYKDQLQRSENKRRDQELRMQRLNQEVDECKEKIKRLQNNHSNDINQLKQQLQNYYLKNDERFEVETKLNSQKSRLEEMAMNLNRQLIEKDKSLSLIQIEKQQLSEQLKEKGIDLERAKSKHTECELLKQQLQNQISQLEQSKLRELDLQRRIYDLENQNQEYSIRISNRKQIVFEDL